MSHDHPAKGKSSGDDWAAALDENNVEFVILDLHGEDDLVEFFRLQSGWSVDFEDEEAVIFARAGLSDGSADSRL